MMQSNWLSYISIILLFTSCIKPFDPELNQASIEKYVVEGMVSSVEGWQKVSVSKTSSTSEAQFIPVNGCDVEISDDLGQLFQLEQYQDGLYRVWMNSTDLVVGRSYKVQVITPNGEILESLFDKMPSGPEIGDIYFQIEDIQTNDPEIVRHGIQFYTDFHGSQEDGRYYRWKLTETYEYHSDYALQFYYDENGVNEVIPIDSSKMYCWRTVGIKNIFTLSTINLNDNSLPNYPLNYVSNTTSRLKIMYSLLVEQIALSENAYNYWDKLRMNLSQEGGLYTTQPLNVKGNLINTSNTEKEVLGYFQASSLSATRVFVEPVAGLELEASGSCNIDALKFGVGGIRPIEYPAYLFVVEDSWVNATMSKECVDCTLLGGETTKPDYWPN